MSGVANGIFNVMAANGGSDQALKDAVSALDKGVGELDPMQYQGFVDILRKIPGDYPTTAELEAKGITKSPDDDALGAAMQEVSTALSGLRTTLAAIDPAALKATDETALATARANVGPKRSAPLLCCSNGVSSLDGFCLHAARQRRVVERAARMPLHNTPED